jgi:hypothetical protein
MRFFDDNLEENEGFRAKRYLDTDNNWAVGYGTQVRELPAKIRLDVMKGVPMSKKLARQLALTRFVEGLDRSYKLNPATTFKDLTYASTADWNIGRNWNNKMPGAYDAFKANNSSLFYDELAWKNPKQQILGPTKWSASKWYSSLSKAPQTQWDFVQAKTPQTTEQASTGIPITKKTTPSPVAASKPQGAWDVSTVAGRLGAIGSSMLSPYGAGAQPGSTATIYQPAARLPTTPVSTKGVK